jgi:hypothetical protein
MPKRLVVYLNNKIKEINMILVRNVFQLKFGKAKDAKAIIKDAIALNKKHGVKSTRALTDLTGPSYTLVFETGHDSLSEFESKIQSMFGDKEWGVFYEKMIPLCESAYREIFSVIE